VDCRNENEESGGSISKTQAEKIYIIPGKKKSKDHLNPLRWRVGGRE
jgi:hypothetical protein